MKWLLILVMILAVIAVVYIGFHRWGKMMRKDKSLKYRVRRKGPEGLIDDDDDED